MIISLNWTDSPDNAFKFLHLLANDLNAFFFQFVPKACSFCSTAW
jgi:hypothetical protein